MSSPPPGWYDVGRAAEHCGKTARWIRKLCQVGRISGRLVETPFGPAWYVDPAGLPALRIVTMPLPLAAAPASPADPLAELPGAKRDVICRRMEAVQGLRSAVENRRPGQTRTEAESIFVQVWNAQGRQPRLSWRTIRRWDKQYHDGGVQALTDERHWHGEIDISLDAYRFIEGLWLSEARPTIARIYERAEALAIQNAWALPSYRHICRLLAMLDRKVALAGRDPRRFRDRCLPYAERDWTLVPAMGVWVADHRVFDVLVPCQVWSKEKRRLIWAWRRPWLTMYIDARSWMPAAWSISIEAPDGLRTMATFIRGVREHGRPEWVYLDNGKDFRMALFSGGRKAARKMAGMVKAKIDGKTVFGHVVEERHVRSALEILGIGSIFALPFNAKAKIVEPFFRLVAERFDKNWPTYCGPATHMKPECLKEALKCGAERASAGGFDLASFSAAFNAWINEDYALRESPSAAAGGLSALRAFHELRSPGFSPVRPPDADLSLLLLPSQAITVGQNGIWVECFGRHYLDDALEGRRAASGRDLKRKVTYRFDPDDPSGIWVFDAESGTFLCRAGPYMGGGLHPVATSAEDRDRVAAVMALRRGREKRILSDVRESREAASNILLASARLSAGALGRLDDPATIEPPGPPILQLTEFTRAVQGPRSKVQGPKSDAANPQSTILNPQSSSDPVGAGSVLDLLPDEPAAQPKESRHDSDDDWPDAG